GRAADRREERGSPRGRGERDGLGRDDRRAARRLDHVPRRAGRRDAPDLRGRQDRPPALTETPPPGPRDQRGVVSVALARAEVRNAFDDILIAEATGVFEGLTRDAAARVVVLSGLGKAFCAGADLNWMSRMIAYGIEENRRDSAALAAMLRAI